VTRSAWSPTSVLHSGLTTRARGARSLSPLCATSRLDIYPL
jgi:hypothetical protein